MALHFLLKHFRNRPTGNELPHHLKIQAGQINAARQLESGIKIQGYDALSRHALHRQAHDFIEYRRESLGGLADSQFDLAFFTDGSALIIYHTDDGHIFQATTCEDAEARLQEEKEVSERFARHWRKPTREAS